LTIGSTYYIIHFKKGVEMAAKKMFDNYYFIKIPKLSWGIVCFILLTWLMPQSIMPVVRPHAGCDGNDEKRIVCLGYGPDIDNCYDSKIMPEYCTSIDPGSAPGETNAFFIDHTQSVRFFICTDSTENQSTFRFHRRGENFGDRNIIINRSNGSNGWEAEEILTPGKYYIDPNGISKVFGAYCVEYTRGSPLWVNGSGSNTCNVTLYTMGQYTGIFTMSLCDQLKELNSTIKIEDINSSSNIISIDTSQNTDTFSGCDESTFTIEITAPQTIEGCAAEFKENITIHYRIDGCCRKFVIPVNITVRAASTAELVLNRTEIDFQTLKPGHIFTKAIEIRNDGCNELKFKIVPIVPDGEDSNNFLSHWDWGYKESEITVPGKGLVSPLITYKPQTVGEHEIEFEFQECNGCNADSPPRIKAFGRAVKPEPLSTMMVLDRSGSMNGKAGEDTYHTKMSAAIKAGKMYAWLLNPKNSGLDRFGLTWYNHVAKKELDIKNIDENEVNDTFERFRPGRDLGPIGNTNISEAMENAITAFKGENDEHNMVIIFLTDGKETVQPFLKERLVREPNYLKTLMNDKDIKIFCVGLGEDKTTGTYEHEGIDRELLQKIAEENEGYFLLTGTLDKLAFYNLDKFYFYVFAKAQGYDFAKDPTYMVFPSNNTQEIVQVDIADCDRDIYFLIVSELFKEENYKDILYLVDPSGQIIKTGSKIGGSTINIKKWQNGQLVQVKLPPRSESKTYAGVWKLLMKPVHYLPDHDYNPDDPLSIPHARVLFAAAVGSDYHMQAMIPKGKIFENQPLLLRAKLTEAGRPAPGGTVDVYITKPDGTVVYRKLYDDGHHNDGKTGDAEFAFDFRDTGQSGYYEFFFVSKGITAKGYNVTREELLAKNISLYPTKTLKDKKSKLFGFHVGGTYPLWKFNSYSDSNVHLHLDANWSLSQNLSVLMMFGFNQFTAEISSRMQHPTWTNVSINLRRLFPTATAIKYYLQGGPGWYNPKSGPGKLGFNAGLGTRIPLENCFYLEFGTDLHFIKTDLPKTFFLTFHLGILFH
jgi:hypothetical protein